MTVVFFLAELIEPGVDQRRNCALLLARERMGGVDANHGYLLWRHQGNCKRRANPQLAVNQVLTSGVRHDLPAIAGFPTTSAGSIRHGNVQFVAVSSIAKGRRASRASISVRISRRGFRLGLRFHAVKTADASARSMGASEYAER